MRYTWLKQRLFGILRNVARNLAGRGLGLMRIPAANALYQKLYALLRPTGIVLADVQGFNMYVKLDDSWISSSLISLGTWETEETALFYSLLKPGMTVLDIGANMRYYTLIAAKVVGDTGHVYDLRARSFQLRPGAEKR